MKYLAANPDLGAEEDERERERQNFVLYYY